jgi:hypothetical protein
MRVVFDRVNTIRELPIGSHDVISPGNSDVDLADDPQSLEQPRQFDSVSCGGALWTKGMRGANEDFQFPTPNSNKAEM